MHALCLHLSFDYGALSTLSLGQDAEKIVVMRKGKLAEQGTHDELLKIPIVREVSHCGGEMDVCKGTPRSRFSEGAAGSDTTGTCNRPVLGRTDNEAIVAYK